MTRSTIFRTPASRLATAALAGFAMVLACDDGPSGPDTRQPDAAQSTITVSQRDLPSGETARITLTTRDSTGRRLSRGGATVTFRASRGSSTGTLSQARDHRDGTYSATFAGELAGTPVEIGATVNGDTLTSLPPTITVVPGEYSHGNSPVSVLPRTIDVGETATITLRLVDAAGNDVPRKGRQVAFTAGGGTSVGTMSGTTDRKDGTYVATFRATAA
ncbi:MAG: Ig-like domain-containing protein, partial [Gemmatimonadota bacterium]|nr:Ig-like domain-containing protein [Gemmatimonadota bacterium]